jgi:hypothetical protein
VETYRIGVALAMTSDHKDVLGALSRDLLHVHAKIDDLQQHFGRLALAIGGALSAMAGVGLLKTLTEITGQASKLNAEVTRLYQLGRTPAEVSGITAAAQQATRDTRGITQSGYLSAYGNVQAYGTTEQERHALAALGARYERVTGREGSARTLIQAGELSGQILDPNTHRMDIGRLQRFADIMIKLRTVTHGQVTEETARNVAQQAGGLGLSGMNETGIVNTLLAAQATGGQRTGTALQAMNQQFIGGQMTKRVAMELINMGILKPEAVVDAGGAQAAVGGRARPGRAGNYVNVAESAWTNPEMIRSLSRDPSAFIEHFSQALTQRGVTDPQAQARSFYRLFGRGTAQREAAELLLNRGTIEREREAYGKAQGVDATIQTQDERSYDQALKSMKAAWQNVVETFVGPDSATAISIMRGFTDQLRSFNETLIATDPSVLRRLGEGIGVLGLSLTAGGGAAILAAMGPAGWIAAGIVVLGGALFVFRDKFQEFIAWFQEKQAEWDAIKIGWVTKAGELLTWLGTTYVDDWVKEIKTWPGRLADAITTFGSDLVKLIVDNLMGALRPGPDSPLNRINPGQTAPGGPPGGYSPASFSTGGGGGGHTWSDIGQGTMAGGGGAAAGAGGGGGGSSTAARSTAMAAMMDQLRKEGVPEANLRTAAAHLTGQAIMESGLDPTKTHDSGTGYGIYGARDPTPGRGRRTDMFNWLAAHGYARDSLEGQARFMAHEAMSGRYARTRAILMGGDASNAAVNAITKEFESPAIVNDRTGAFRRALEGGGVEAMVSGTGGLRVKSPESVAGGSAAAGVIAAGQWLQQQQGFQRIGAINDRFHQLNRRNSLHRHGLAIDATFGNMAQQTAAFEAAKARAAALGLGPDDTQFISHGPGDRGSTAPHLHLGFKTQEAADRFRGSAVRPPDRAGGSSSIQVRSEIKMDGRKVASGVTRHQSRMADGPSHGGQSFDGTRQHAGPDAAHMNVG